MTGQNAEQETQIALWRQSLALNGWNGGDPIVLRGRTEVALGEFVLGSLRGEFVAAVRAFPAEEYRGDHLVIGTRDARDNDRIREACEAARAAVSPRPLM